MATWIEVSRAHAAVTKALRDGTIVTKPCEVCGGKPTHAHHPDYTEQLNIKWLCPTHHRREHLRLGRPLMDHWTVLNIRGVPPEMVSKAKIKALNLNISLKDLVIAAVEQYCETNVEKKPAARGKKAAAVVADPLGVALELAASGVELPAVVVESKPVIIAPVHQVPERAVNHAENCRCYLCKPPK